MTAPTSDLAVWLERTLGAKEAGRIISQGEALYGPATATLDKKAVATPQPSERQREAGYEIVALANGEAILASEHVNRTLEDKRTILVDPGHPERIKEAIRQHRDGAGRAILAHLCFRKAGRDLTNEDKLCLTSEIEAGKDATCGRGTYFDSIATNEACGSILRDRRNEHPIADGRVMFPATGIGEGRTLLDMAASGMNNHIGASAIAISRDGWACIRRQGHGQQQNGGAWVTTGSGSCDWGDLRPTLAETIKLAMERELTEEIQGEATDAKTLLVGFFLWIRRGAKPEFVGITRVDTGREGLAASDDEREHGTGEELELDFRNREAALHSLEQLEERARLDQVSTPLAALIWSLKRRLERGDPEIETFLWRQKEQELG